MPRLSDNRNKLVRSQQNFTDDYKMRIFTLWYNSGKPTSERLYSLIVSEDIKEPLSGDIPTKNTISLWIKRDFESKATFLDNQAMKDLEKQLVKSKLELLNAHALIGKELQVMGMKYLKEKELGNARNALSAVIEGLRIERESSGVSVKFAELDKLNDDELLEELALIVETSDIIDIEPNEQ